jgi:voltage-gated potassium channel
VPDESTAEGRILVDRQLGSRIALPEQARSPWWELGRRLLAAAAILIGTVLIVYFDRTGYRDGNDPLSNYAVDFKDSIYYTTVTLSTTGY